VSDHQTKFKLLLRELFQFESADLDFGIYRIMNHKREVIERFIDEDLPQAIDDELDRGALAEQSRANQALEAARKKVLDALGDDALDVQGNLAEKYRDIPAGKEYLTAQAHAAGARDHQALEAAIYNHLYSFFSRYYQDGDFISKRRYSKRERYAIPYNGEEVYLYWANHDQYYIKTAEYFGVYAYKAPNGVNVRFKLQAADVEKDNVKGDKRFFLPRLDGISWDEAIGELIIPFEYRPLTPQEAITYGRRKQQETIIAGALETIPRRLTDSPRALAALSAERRKTTDGDPVSYLEHHLRRYTARNTRDFFIHKDLAGFLSRELDFYLKNEVLNLEEMEAAGEDLSEGWFQLLRLIKRVGSHIIEFLAQIENFQKMLWEKKKFVTETFYCITVGNIPEAFYPEIAECDPQWQEWQDLLAVETPQGKDKRIAFLEAHPTLALDTRYFSQSFTDHLLASLDDLDKVTDGVLVHSENWQALSLLMESYRERVKCVFIDPPYNTGTDGFAYKDSYQHSSWLALMNDRISAGRVYLQGTGMLFCCIDEIELHRLRGLLAEIFNDNRFVGNLTWIATTQPDNIGKARFNLQKNAEYVLTFAKCPQPLLPAFSLRVSGSKRRYPHRGRFGPCRFEIIERSFEGAYARPTMQFEILGRKPREGKQWQVGEETARQLEAAGKLEIVNDIVKRAVYPEDEADADVGLIPFWAHLKNVDTSQKGKAELTSIVGRGHGFDTVKPVSLPVSILRHLDEGGGVFLDYFAGSGTTGHAVINLNREDGGRRKFILVEMAHYFDTVLLPRIKKVTFTPEWKDGAPKRLATQEEVERGPRIIKVIRLESYEDALNNIAFDAESGQQAMQFDDYLLRYMLKWETRASETLLDVEKLSRPFSYQLRIHRDDETRIQPVDLPETFNYLLGLHVRTRRVHDDDGRRYLVYRGMTRRGRTTAVIWRETEGWKEEDYQRDKRFVAENKLTEGADEVFVNGDSLIPGARALEGLFKARMFADVEVYP